MPTTTNYCGSTYTVTRMGQRDDGRVVVNLQRIGKRGKPVNYHRAALWNGAKFTHVSAPHRF